MQTVGAKAQHSAATRGGIVSAALRLFAERGFASTSIADIAGAAGITKGAIYWHFDSKDALFKAILEGIRRDWQDVVRGPLEREKDPVRLNSSHGYISYAVFCLKKKNKKDN